MPTYPNPLRKFFYDRETGPGIWKWDHYFDIYHRHFSKFRRKPVTILEIGIYSGGSLDMWHDYFGPRCSVIGVDIQPECKAYERDGVQVFIGDQAKPEFWNELRQAVPVIDIVVDDGSHKARHQATTFRELWQHIAPGGVYLCEDIHGYPENAFAEIMHNLAGDLNDHRGFEKNKENHDRRLVKVPTEFQSQAHSMHFYPYVVVVEKHVVPVTEFIAPKRGTEWQPFLGQ